MTHTAEYDAGVRAAAEAVREAMHGPAYAGDPWVCKDAIEAALARVIPPATDQESSDD